MNKDELLNRMQTLRELIHDFGVPTNRLAEVEAELHTLKNAWHKMINELGVSDE